MFLQAFVNIFKVFRNAKKEQILLTDFVLKKIGALFLESNLKPHIMKKVILLAFLAFGMQQAQAQYKFLQYRNVSEKNEAEFLKRETEYWSKMAKANIKSGKMQAWSLWKKVGVAGEPDAKPNYLFVNDFKTLADFDTLESGWANPEKVFPNMKLADMETGSISKVLYTDIMKTEAQIEGNPKFVVINYAKPTSVQAFVEENINLWKPFFESEQKKGYKLNGWGLQTVIYPQGNTLEFSALTWDGFTKLSEALDHLQYRPSSQSRFASIAKDSKMSTITPNGFQFSPIYELVMYVDATNK